jgi:hypothetical protein
MTKLGIIAHTGNYSACLQPKLVQEGLPVGDVWKRAILYQVIENIDPNCYHSLNFWGTRLDNRNSLLADGTTRTFSLKTTALVFEGNIFEDPLCGTIDPTDAFIKVEICPGTPDQIDLTTPGTAPTEVNQIIGYDFESYYALQNCSSAKIQSDTVTIVFIAEEVNAETDTSVIDPLVGGIWYIDDVIFK